MEKYYSKDFFLEKTKFKDLEIYNVGEAKCEPSHSFGPYVRPQLLLHYIFSGKGCFEVNNMKFYLGQNQAFLIYPDVVTYYYADEKEPWHYGWLSFGGNLSMYYLHKIGFSKQNPIYTPVNNDRDIYELFIEILKSPYNSIRTTGYAHLIFDKLINTTTNIVKDHSLKVKRKYVDMIINYFEFNYWKEIYIHDLANLCNLDRSYLTKIFKEEIGMSPQQYLIKLRFEKAQELLKKLDLSVADCARSVGYNDQFAFSKMFKKQFNMTPSQYRQVFYKN